MTRAEMITKLFKNPKLKAIDTNKDIVFVDVSGFIMWERGRQKLDCKMGLAENWTIIEPQRKLKQMTFGEAYFEVYKNDNLVYYDVVSVLSGKGIVDFRKVTKEQYMGLWTVKGVYEDESEE